MFSMFLRTVVNYLQGQAVQKVSTLLGLLDLKDEDTRTF